MTLGDQILAARLDRHLLQKELAKIIGVNTWTVMNWEKNHFEPHMNYYPRIMNFLGYCPVQRAEYLGGWVKIHRIHRGFSQKETAHLIGVDPSTLAGYERRSSSPSGKYLSAMKQFIG